MHIQHRNVHCRIGSLENRDKSKKRNVVVHCRIGSLVTAYQSNAPTPQVHCRIGSLEIQQQWVPLKH